jgi:hypothetical protein
LKKELKMGNNIDKLVAAYRNLRDAIAEKEAAHTKEIGELRDKMETVSATLLEFCNENGLDSVKTPEGTVSRRVRTRYWSSDWDSFHRFVEEHQAFHLLEKRIHNGNMAQFLEENPDLHPQGLQADRKYTIQVRKPKVT